MMRADIQTVPLSIIRNAFQVILQYGITVTCSEIFKGSCFTIHEVQSSPSVQIQMFPSLSSARFPTNE